MKLIAFTGGMGVGKSTAIQYLKDYQKNSVRCLKFAQPLYDMQDMIYRRISQVHARPSTFIKDRKLLQWLGTEWGRDTISQNLWVDLWKAEVAQLSADEPDTIIVCDDLRFNNEAEVVKSLAGKVVKVVTEIITDRDVAGNGIKNHISEGGISLGFVDIVVENNTSMKDFLSRLDVVFADYCNIQSVR